MKHKHHIIPRYMGGSDDPSNLIELTVEEHAQAHLDLYEKHGNWQDLGAWYLLTGNTWDPEYCKMISSMGGKVQGPINAESGHMKRIQQLGDVVENGRKGGRATIESGKGAFGDPEERLKSAIKGGKAQGKINAENGHLKNISKDYWKKVKSGEINRKKKYWATNGTDNLMLSENETMPEGYFKGKTQKG
jgi:hypothetical protein